MKRGRSGVPFFVRQNILQTVSIRFIVYLYNVCRISTDACGRLLFDYYLNGDLIPVAADGKPVELRFETMPDRLISLRAWNIASITEENKYSLINDAVEISVPDNRFLLPEDGVFLYELCAEWDERDGVGEDAVYAFLLSARTDEAK